MLQRTSGTVFGVLVGIGLLLAQPAPWVVILLLAALQRAAEMAVLRDYAFGLFFATPVALLVSSPASTASASELAFNRLWTTLLGAAIGVVVAWVSPHRAWLFRLHGALARARALLRRGTGGSGQAPGGPGRTARGVRHGRG